MRTKPLAQPQLFEIYSSIEEQTPNDSRMKLVGALVDKVDLREVYATYRSGGCPPYDPRAMLKAIIFAFINNIYSSRKIENCLKYDARYRWLAGRYEPSYRTILRFISDHLKGKLGQVFSDIVTILINEGYIDIAEVYVDGTTIESRASRYSILWRNNVKRHAINNTEKIKALVGQIFITAEAEQKGNYPESIGEMMSDDEITKIANTLTELRESGAEVPKTAVTELNKRLGKAKEYNNTLKKMGDRNSMSKTDPDAIGMHPKDDVTKNGPCLAMHNLQIATNSQFVLGFGLFSLAADSRTLPAMLNMLMGNLTPDTGMAFNGKGALKELTADAGYGSLDNIEACEACGITPYLKYAGYEQPLNYKFSIDAMPYNADDDTYTCPAGKKLRRVSQRQVHEENRQPRTYATYRCDDCPQCPLKEKCLKNNKSRKESEVCLQWRQARQKLKSRLDSPRGQALLKNRTLEPEPVFGIQKWDHQYRRFRHFSRSGIITDLMLLFIAHNIAKAHEMGMGSGTTAQNGPKTPILSLMGPRPLDEISGLAA